MDRIGRDLVLLAIDPARGRVRGSAFLRYGLMGSELVRLIAAGRIDMQDGRIVAAVAGPTGDPNLDAALTSILGARRPPRAASWIGRPRRQIVGGYLSMLAAGGVVASTGSGRRTRWEITDPAAAASARERLDRTALGLAPAGITGAAYAGLAHAAQLDQVLYRGRGSRAIRKRCAQLGKGQGVAFELAAADAADAGQAAVEAAILAVAAAAIRASVAAASSSG